MDVSYQTMYMLIGIIFFVIGFIIGSLLILIIRKKKRLGTYYIFEDEQNGYLEFNEELDIEKLKNKDLIIKIQTIK